MTLSHPNTEDLISIFWRSVTAFCFAGTLYGCPDWWFCRLAAYGGLVGSITDSCHPALGVGIPFLILGGGSNILVSDLGVRQSVILNKARQIRFDLEQSPSMVSAELGANFGLMARQCARRGLSGLEWAAGIPGTVGGAVFGNAGAHGVDVAGSLQMAEILHRTKYGIVQESWPLEIQI